MSEDYKEAFEKTKVAGSIAASALNEVNKIIRPGISTDEIDKETLNKVNKYSCMSNYYSDLKNVLKLLNYCKIL